MRPPGSIEAIAFRERLPAAEKVRRIQDVLRRRGEPRQALEQQIARFKDDLQRTGEERAYCDVLERNRSSCRTGRRTSSSRSASRARTTTSWRPCGTTRPGEGRVAHTAPMAFLGDEHRPLLTRPDGTFRVSLYKALLFLGVADALKSGALHVEESYRYRSLDDYLIAPEEWRRQRDKYLEQADLAEAGDCRGLLQRLAADLDHQYATTNQNILSGANEHITFTDDGGFHLRTPGRMRPDAEPLGSFFPQGRYIPLLEVLATVNRHSQFLDAFRHWRVRYPGRGRPNDCSSPGSSATAARSGRRRWPGSPAGSASRSWSGPSTGTSPPRTSPRPTTRSSP